MRRKNGRNRAKGDQVSRMRKLLRCIKHPICPYCQRRKVVDEPIKPVGGVVLCPKGKNAYDCIQYSECPYCTGKLKIEPRAIPPTVGLVVKMVLCMARISSFIQHTT